MKEEQVPGAETESGGYRGRVIGAGRGKGGCRGEQWVQGWGERWVQGWGEQWAQEERSVQGEQPVHLSQGEGGTG